jgi:hypothetical protein
MGESFMKPTAWLLFALVFLAQLAIAAAPQLSPEQTQTIDKLKTRGASVMQVAADTDTLTVNLSMMGKKAGDEDLAAVKSLPKVTELNLGGTSVTDAGLENIKAMTSLTHLYLDRTQITDAGLAHLKDLTNLTYLNLYNSPGITDKGLANLEGMKNLKKLYLWQTKVTGEGAGTLKSSLPGVIINRGEELAAITTKPADKLEKKPDDKKPDDKKPDDKKPAVADYKPDNEGFIHDWLLLAPIALGDAAGLSGQLDMEQIPDEKNLKPKEGDKAKIGDKELTWKAVHAKDYFVDINMVLGATTANSAAYAVCYIESPAEMKDVQIRMGSNDEGKVILNGAEVLKYSGSRGLDKDLNRRENLTLIKGTNVVVFKIINEQNAWQGCIRFTDRDGNPIKDVKLKLGA